MTCGASFTCSASGLTVTFTSTLTGTAGVRFWDFGDGEFAEFLVNPIHTYDSPGSYTVTLYAIELDSGNTESPKTITHVKEQRQGGISIISSSDAYALFAASSWGALSSVQNNSYSSSYQEVGGIDQWRYRARRITSTVPLDQLAGNQAIIEERALIYITGRANRYSKHSTIANPPLWKTVSGSDLSTGGGSPFGIVMHIASGIPNQEIMGLIDPTISMVSSVFTIDDSSQNDPYDELSDPKAIGENSISWSTLLSNFGVLKILPYNCIAIFEDVCDVGLPIARFSATPRKKLETLTSQFTDLSTESPTSWSWKRRPSGILAPYVEFSTSQNPSEDFDVTDPTP